MRDKITGSARTCLSVDSKNTLCRGRMADCAAVRDDAAKPRLTVPKNLKEETTEMLKGLIGKKVGMTQIFDDAGSAIPVTLIEAGPCYVTQVRMPESDG